MRKAKYRRRIRRYSIYLLFTVTLFIAYDISFGYTLKGLVEQRLNRVFSDSMTFDIEHIEGGVFRDIVSNGITIFHPDLKEPFRLDRVEVPYRIWYPLVKKYGQILNLKTEGLKLFFGEDNPIVNGYFLFEGDKSDLRMLGVFSLLGRKEDITFIGKAAWVKDSIYNVDIRLNKDVKIKGLVDFQNESLLLEITTEKGKVNLDITSEGDNKLIIKARLEHIDLKGTDLIADVGLTIEQFEDTTRFSMILENMIINFSPFNKIVEINGEVMQNKEIFKLSSIVIKDAEHSSDEGENVIKGYAVGMLSGEKYIKSEFIINKVKTEDFMLDKYAETKVEGILNGDIKMRGPLKELESDIHLSLHDGKINDF